MSATVVAERAQKDEDSRVNVRAAVRWMQLLEALGALLQAVLEVRNEAIFRESGLLRGEGMVLYAA